jgi:hypothetical protein
VLSAGEGGKSTLLASLALHGHTILSDDLVVIEGGRVFAGPRCLDLRPSAAEWLSAVDAPLVRDESRARLQLRDAPHSAPLRGIVYLAWGERIEVAKVPLAERIVRLRAQNSFVDVLPPWKHGLLELAALPTYELRRPRDFEDLPASAEALLAALPG